MSTTTRRFLLPTRNLAASVYGTILVSSVIVGLAQTNLTATQMMVAVAVTALVFGLAHAWSTALARSASDREALAFDHLAEGVRHELPMVTAVLPTLVALSLAALDAYSPKTGLWVAIIANTALLFCWGAILRHQAEGTALQWLMAGLTTATLGLMLIALKALIH
jgi:hypothetical protein